MLTTLPPQVFILFFFIIAINIKAESLFLFIERGKEYFATLSAVKNDCGRIIVCTAMYIL